MSPCARPLTLPLVAMLALAVPVTGQAIIRGPEAVRADSVLRSLVPKGFSGVVLVSKAGQPILSQGYGMADREAGIPMAPNSVVQIGSNTKDFTAVAILQLMEQGKLALTDSLGRFFKEVPADKRGITIDMLLNHRAGFDQHMGGDDEQVTREAEIQMALAAALRFPAGTSRAYSNIGYSLLAAIIEQLSGGSYDRYVQDHIFTPLGMRETGLLRPHFDPRRLARGYRDGQPQPTFVERPHDSDGVWWNLRGNGGMLSTLADMQKFYRALMSDGPLLKPSSRNLMFHPDEPAVLAGSDMTYYFFYTRAPRAGLDIFLATNSNDFPAPQARGTLDAALGLAAPPGAGGGQIVTAGPGGGRRGGGGNASVAAVTLPQTHAGKAAQRYLQIWLANNADSTRIFLRDEVIQAPDDHRTLDERLARNESMHKDLGSLTPIEILNSTDLEISFKARTGQQEEVTINFMVEPQAPWRIMSLRILAG